MSFRSLSLLIAAGLAGCAGGPAPKIDAPVAPAAFKNAVAAQAVVVPDAWWQLFNDPQLDALQAQLLIGNEDVRAAVGRVDAARAALGQLRALQQPSLGVTAGATRADSGSGAAQNTLRAELAASWEPDLFGRLGLASTAGAARLQASEADLAALRLTAQATLVQSYFELRAAEAQQALFERSITAYERSLALTRDRS